MRHSLTRIAAVAVAIAAAGAPAAVARDLPSDMRSPDARDADQGRGTFNAPDVVVVRSQDRPAPVAEDGGLDWGDAGIGAGIIGGVLLVASGGVLVAHRRSPAAV